MPASQALAQIESVALGHHMVPQSSCSSWTRPITRYPDGMSAAVIWLIVALGLAGAEALTGDMFLLMLAETVVVSPKVS